MNRLGPIPSWVAGLTNLVELDLNNSAGGTSYTGPIPDLSALTKLTTLNLSGNTQLDPGSLPSGLPASLKILAMSQTNRTGSIPLWLANTFLSLVDLSSNHLEGEIPAQLGNSTSLKATLTSLNLSGNKISGEIPTSLMNLAKLIDKSSDLRWNALLSKHSGLIAFLNSKQTNNNWQSTQTVPPDGIKAVARSAGSVEVSWLPITYTADIGGYKVYSSTSRGGPYTLAGTTTSKTVTSSLVDKVDPGSTVFVVRSFTSPHTNNPNTVESGYTSEVSAGSVATQLIGTWAGQGVYSYNPSDGSWTYLAPPASQLAAGDLHGKGSDDLIGVWDSGVWSKDSTTGDWTKLASPAQWIATAEMNGDNKTDLIGIWDSAIYWRDSDSGAWSPLGIGATQVLAGDMDGDGKADLVGMWPNGLWVQYSSTGQWSQVASPPTWIAIGDMNGDGLADIVGIWDSSVYLRDSKTGDWTLLTTGASQVTAGDLDADGKTDLIGTWPDGIWVKSSGTGSWQRLSSAADWITTGRLKKP